MKGQRLLLAAALLLPLLILTGCWDSPSPVETDPVPGENETETSAENQPVLPETFALAYEANATLDPITCGDGVQQVVGALVYEGLFQLDRTLSPQPRLCTSYTYDPEGFTYVLTLRSGVLFSDGSALTAADVVQTLRRAKLSDRYGSRLADMVSVSGGDGTVTVALSGPNASFPALLDIPIVKSGTESSQVPLGTGAYCWAEDASGPYLAANTHWWEGLQPLERIRLSHTGGTDTLLYQFTAHEIQLFTADLTGADLISATGSIQFQDADTTVFQFIGLNTARAPFDSPAVRQALSLGIDRNHVVNALLSGHGVPAQFPVSPRSPLYPSELEEAYSYDAFATAAETAGLTSGTPQAVTLLVNQENSFKTAVAEYIASALSDFDLKVTVRILPWEEYTAALAAGDFDLYYGEVKLTADWDLGPLIGTAGTLNYGGWSNTWTDALLTAYLSAGDSSAMESLCAHLKVQAPILPVCFKSTSVFLQDGVMEGLAPTMTDPFYGLRDLVFHLRNH